MQCVAQHTLHAASMARRVVIGDTEFLLGDCLTQAQLEALEVFATAGPLSDKKTIDRLMQGYNALQMELQRKQEALVEAQASLEAHGAKEASDVRMFYEQTEQRVMGQCQQLQEALAQKLSVEAQLLAAQASREETEIAKARLEAEVQRLKTKSESDEKVTELLQVALAHTTCTVQCVPHCTSNTSSVNPSLLLETEANACMPSTAHEM